MKASNLATGALFLTSAHAASLGAASDAATAKMVSREVDRRATPETSNDFLDLGCRDVILFFARGSGEPGNMGVQPGRQLADALGAALGASALATQGVPYSARPANPGDFDMQGVYRLDTAVFRDLLEEAARECPLSKLVVSGYSQGVVLLHAALLLASDDVMGRIVAAVGFGYTEQVKSNGVLPGVRTASALFCNPGDVICEKGEFRVTPAHEDYVNRVPEAVDFIKSVL